MPPLTPEEEALASLVERAGLSRLAARCFIALARGGGRLATELAEMTALARQDVSQAAKELTARGMVHTERVASGGRPLHRYSLARDAGESVRELTSARRKWLADEGSALDALDARFH